MAERAIRFNGDAMCLAEGEIIRLAETRVHFDLVHRWGFAGIIDNSLKMLGKEVADASHADSAFLLQFEQRLPCLLVEIDCGEWPMNQVHVDYIHAQLATGFLERDACRIIALIAVAQFGGHPYFVGHASSAQCIADLFLVVVSGCSIDVTVTDFQRFFDGPLRIFGRNLECAESDLWNNSVSRVLQGDSRRLQYLSHIFLLRAVPVPTSL